MMQRKVLPAASPSRRRSGTANGASPRQRASELRRPACAARERINAADAGKTACAFGATRVGPLLERLRLHLATDRFLARRRHDLVWEAGCDYAGLALARLASQLSGTRRASRLVLTPFSAVAAGRSGRR